ncbi:hypothetical protein ACWC1D_35415, partial [Streptomyces sp. NPDC001478]
MVNAGAVVRRGDLVERPAPRSAPALHAHLHALRAHGFDGAPLPVGPVTDGRERLTFLPGDVALPPFPSWAMTEDALRSVGALLRRLHDASADVPLDTHAPWPDELSDPQGLQHQQGVRGGGVGGDLARGGLDEVRAGQHSE